MSTPLSLGQIDKLNDLLSSAAGIVRLTAHAANECGDLVRADALINAAHHAAQLVDEALGIIHGLNKPASSAEVQS